MQPGDTAGEGSAQGEHPENPDCGGETVMTTVCPASWTPGQNRDCFLQIPLKDSLVVTDVHSDITQHSPALPPALCWLLAQVVVLTWSSM